MYVSARTNEYYRAELSVEQGKATVSVPVRDEFFHAFAVHGSVYFKVLDDAAFFAANSLVTDVFLLTASFTTYMTRPVTEGRMIGTGTVVHRSQRLFIAEAVLTDATGRQLGRGSGTFMRSQVPLDEKLGYA
jgi:uncharacterized protein (TIGR00369 family)